MEHLPIRLFSCYIDKVSSDRFLEQFLIELENRSDSAPHHSLPEESRTLEAHQVRAMTAISDAVREEIGHLQDVHISVQQGGGTGKTTLITNLVGAAMDTRAQLGLRDGRIIILATERALINGIRKELNDLGMTGDMIGQWGSGKRQIDRPVTIASIQAMQHDADLTKHFPPENNLMVIGDEADVYLTSLRKDAVQKLGGIVRVGLTATPEWPDGRHMEDLWGPLVTEFSLLEGIRNGVNVPPVWTMYEAQIDESSIGVERGDYKEKEKAQAFAAIEIEKSIVELYGTLVPEDVLADFPAMIYVPSTALVHRVADALQERFDTLRIRQWTGDSTSSTELHQDVEDYENGMVDALVLCQMGGRALNLPHARVLIDADPTLSPPKLEQRHARVLRRLRGEEERKPFGVIAQIVPRSTKHRCVCLPDVLEGTWDNAVQRQPLAIGNRGDIGRAQLKNAMAYMERIHEAKPIVHLTRIDALDLYAPKTVRETKLVKSFSERMEELNAFRAENPDRWPSSKSKDEAERSLGTWFNNMRQKLRDDPAFAAGEGKALLEMGVEPAQKEKSFKERTEGLKILRGENPDKWPSPTSNDEVERSLGAWLSNVRQKLRDDPAFAAGEGKALLEMGVEPAQKEKSFKERTEELKIFRGENPDKWPSKSKDEAERSLGLWLSKMRQKLRDDPAFAAGEGKALLEMGVEPAQKRT